MTLGMEIKGWCFYVINTFIILFLITYIYNTKITEIFLVIQIQLRINELAFVLFFCCIEGTDNLVFGSDYKMKI